MCVQLRTSALSSRESETPSPSAGAPDTTTSTQSERDGVDILSTWTERIGAALARTTSTREMLNLYLAATKEIPLDQYRKNDTFGHMWVCYARLLHRCVCFSLSLSLSLSLLDISFSAHQFARA